MKHATEIKIDRAGRVVIPKPLRERLGIKPGTRLEAHEERHGLLLRCKPERPTLVRERGLWVHHGEPRGGVDLEHLIDEVREQRARAILES